MNWFIAVIKKYAVFDGRARRTEYWMFNLFNFLIVFVLEIPFFAVSSMSTNSNSSLPSFLITLFTSIVSLYSLALIIPSLAVTVRRLHDIGKSGWWYFISIVPVIGGIWLLVLLCTDSEPGLNQYGPNPKEIS
jgi:uncharacterized membrane protein YhaH (DUF805 family)